MKTYNPLTVALLSLPLVLGLGSSYTNTSSVVSTLTSAPIFCGGCQLIYEVHGHVWWPTIYTDYVATMVYTVDQGSGSTIGSELQPRPNSTMVFGEGINFTSVAYNTDGGAVETTYLNSLLNGPQTTIIQENEITMNATASQNGYVFSTQFLNTSLIGTAQTQCIGTYLARPTLPTVDGFPGLPTITRYTYTAVIPFNDSYNMSKAIQYGIDSLASHVATYLNLSIPACTSNTGGGVGTLKIGVTALTATSTVLAQAQVTPTPTPPTPTPTPPAPSPTPIPSASSPASKVQSSTPIPGIQSSRSTPEVQTSSPTPGTGSPTSGGQAPSQTPQNTGSSMVTTQPAPSQSATIAPLGHSSTIVIIISTPGGGVETSSIVIPISPESPAASASLTQSTTLVTTISGAGGVEIISTVVPVGSEPYTTVLASVITGPNGIETTSNVATVVVGPGSSVITIVQVTSGASGLETLSRVTTVPAGSYISSTAAITPIATSGGGSMTKPTGSSSIQTAITGGGYRKSASDPAVVLGLGLIVSLINTLL
ncbi:hypothetical protein BP5796_06981 [Coleophoma crateriformis]|uniref:Uncharacterized protein n=1 Tax=Coleophoma crateriformis TaxID=565419 RepID=A0A3D8RQB7_9HELO|nr:hypothetical protein BP5796_06981 [Coleophoma crateriformis]